MGVWLHALHVQSLLGGTQKMDCASSSQPQIAVTAVPVAHVVQKYPHPGLHIWEHITQTAATHSTRRNTHQTAPDWTSAPCNMWQRPNHYHATCRESCARCTLAHRNRFYTELLIGGTNTTSELLRLRLPAAARCAVVTATWPQYGRDHQVNLIQPAAQQRHHLFRQRPQRHRAWYGVV